MPITPSSSTWQPEETNTQDFKHQDTDTHSDKETFGPPTLPSSTSSNVLTLMTSSETSSSNRTWVFLKQTDSNLKASAGSFKAGIQLRPMQVECKASKMLRGLSYISKASSAPGTSTSCNQLLNLVRLQSTVLSTGTQNLTRSFRRPLPSPWRRRG